MVEWIFTSLKTKYFLYEELSFTAISFGHCSAASDTFEYLKNTSPSIVDAENILLPTFTDRSIDFPLTCLRDRSQKWAYVMCERSLMMNLMKLI